MDVKPPVESLPELYPPGRDHPLWVITGTRQSGKTLWCQKIVSEARKSGLHVSGILTPGRYENGHRNGIYAVRLADDETRLLASQLPGELDGLRFGPWTFDNEVFAWGNQHLLELKATTTDLLVVDELGFLEFDRGQGWVAAFNLLSQRNYRAAIVIIRPECIQSFASLGYQFATWEVPAPLSDQIKEQSDRKISPLAP